MAIAVSNTVKHSSGDQFKVIGTITFDSSYPTGGETLTVSNLGLAYLEDMSFTDSSGYTYDITIAAGGATAVIKVYWSAGSAAAMAEVSNTTDLSAVAPKFVAYGK